MSRLYVALMFGAREWAEASPIESEIKKLVRKHGTKDLLIISGGAPGADTLAEMMAHKHDVHCAVVKALWETRYRSAGPQRNDIMRRMGPDIGIGFHADLSRSKGTKNMFHNLKRHGIPSRHIDA